MPKIITKYNAHLHQQENQEKNNETTQEQYIMTEAKQDEGKIQMSLVPSQIIKDIAKVRMYGCQKYSSPANWVTVEKQRYIDALLRHLYQYLDDNSAIDEESGLPTIAHVACNVAFLCEMEREDWEERKIQIIKKYINYNENSDMEENA